MHFVRYRAGRFHAVHTRHGRVLRDSEQNVIRKIDQTENVSLNQLPGLARLPMNVFGVFRIEI